MYVCMYAYMYTYTRTHTHTHTHTHVARERQREKERERVSERESPSPRYVDMGAQIGRFRATASSTELTVYVAMLFEMKVLKKGKLR